MTKREHSESILIASDPPTVYNMVSDITRMGEWSPVCRSCWWDDDAGPSRGAAPQPGDGFTGRNETPERTWETHSEVETADPGREFAFLVSGGWTRWGYEFESVDGGTRVTESWHFLPAGEAGFAQRYGDPEETEAQIDKRYRMAREGIPATLAAIKAAAEVG